MEKSAIDKQENIGEVNEISHEKLPPMSENSTFMFHHNFCPKPKTDLENAKISEETQHKLQILKQDYDDIVNKHGSDIGLTQKK